MTFPAWDTPFAEPREPSLHKRRSRLFQQQRARRAQKGEMQYVRSPPTSQKHMALPTSTYREVTLAKAPGTPLGMVLVKPTVGGDQHAVLIASVTPDGAAAKTRRIQAGDMLCAVNGTKVHDYKHAAELLREAPQGSLTLVISMDSELPPGWKMEVDKKGATCYRNQGLNVTSYFHPAAAVPVAAR